MADFLFDGKSSGAKDRKKGGKAAKKESKEEFLARTQAKREARQQSKQEEAATKTIQALFRRAKDLSGRKREAEYEFDAEVEGEWGGAGWKEVSGIVRRLNFLCGQHLAAWLSNVNRVSKCVAILLPLFLNPPPTPYLPIALSKENAAVFRLQMSRLSSAIAGILSSNHWTLADTSNPRLGALLQALIVVTDSSLWKPITTPPLQSAAQHHCSSLLQHLVLKQSLFASLRDGLMRCQAAGASASQVATLLGTLALRPLSLTVGDGKVADSEVAFSFSREILSIPQLPLCLPKVLLPSLSHPTVWPRVVYSLGSVARK
eukprot:CAMPEP_0169481552 /NCGR_PEP_ID=MMETSP1042-20121227/30182_1 /TAXON_ID=464988 /ORGANISM="Hemiselmis andersenii, Strain CCMP1180" /LENGTH=316 /DNA_ID=CAMNT_0009596319 /DNA_START=51 /DNA_END=998 /DNA_ORIENTATION=+